MIVTAGATNKSVYFYVQQDAGGTNPGEAHTGMAFGDLTSASYARQGAARQPITPATLASASAAHSDGGFILVDDTNMPGVYRLDVPDAAFATGVDQVYVHIVPAGAQNATVSPIAVDITDVDLRDSVRGGMTALPNAAADGIGGLPISDAGGLDMDALNTAVAGIQTDLSNGTDGLGALKALVDTVNTDLGNGTDGLGALKALIDTVNTDLGNGTDGLGALAALINGLNDAPAVTAAVIADAVWDELQSGHIIAGSFGVTATEIAALQTDLDNGTDGLGALKALLDTLTTNVGTVDTVVDGIQTDLSNGIDGLGALAALINGLNDIATSDVLTQVNAALDTAISELGVAAPTATPTLRTGLMLLYMALRNKAVVQTSGTDALEFYNDAGTKITQKLLTDDGSDLTEAEMS